MIFDRQDQLHVAMGYRQSHWETSLLDGVCKGELTEGCSIDTVPLIEPAQRANESRPAGSIDPEVWQPTEAIPIVGELS